MPVLGERRMIRNMVEEKSTSKGGMIKMPSKIRIEARTSSCQVKRIRSIILFEYEIFQYEVEPGKNSK